MDWPRLIDFIRQRDPGFIASIEGVPAGDVAAMAADAGVALPAAYAGFLERMGVRSEPFTPFGATQDHGFPAILQRLDDEADTFSGRYMPVAIETDTSLEALYDHHIDLALSDGTDAPLVLLEQVSPVDEQPPIDLGETLGERITAGAFTQFELERLAERGLVHLGGTLHPGEGRAALVQALSLLQLAGFEPVLPPLSRVVCLRAGDVSLLAQVDESVELLSLRFGSDHALAVRSLTDQLLAGLPGARLPAGPRTLG